MNPALFFVSRAQQEDQGAGDVAQHGFGKWSLRLTPPRGAYENVVLDSLRN